MGGGAYRRRLRVAPAAPAMPGLAGVMSGGGEASRSWRATGVFSAAPSHDAPSRLRCVEPRARLSARRRAGALRPPPVLIVETFVIHKRFHGLVQRASRWSKRNAERANKIPVVRGLIARSSAVVALLTRRAPRNFPLSNGRSPTVTIGRSKTVCLPRRVTPLP